MGSVGPAWPAASLLGRLPEPVRVLMLGLGRAVQVEPGRAILRLGEPPGRSFLLLNGCVKVLGNDSGREPLLDIRVGGDLVGEMSVLSGAPRSATVITCSLTVAREISGRELRQFLLNEPQASLAVASMLAERLRWANERRVDFATVDAGVRVSRVLLALAYQYGQPCPGGHSLGVSLTQEEIASLAGVRLPTAEKHLRLLARAGVIRVGYRTVLVTDLDGLARAADPEAL
ncbi:MAG TPA: Crp/Fnr family transcriptional regulator [Micromonosporaceae bacterium]|nr:Crp/Fnr family transcriptional regulator [Micromonosporaceae bacterium]